MLHGLISQLKARGVLSPVFIAALVRTHRGASYIFCSILRSEYLNAVAKTCANHREAPVQILCSILDIDISIAVIG